MVEPEHLAWGRQFALRREAARRAAWTREARRASGVCWSGFGPGAFVARSEDELEREARAWAAMRQARLATGSEG